VVYIVVVALICILAFGIRHLVNKSGTETKEEETNIEKNLEYFENKYENPTQADIINIYQKIESIVCKKDIEVTFQGNLDFDRENVPKNQLIRIYFKFPFIKTIDQELFPSVGENLGQHYGRFIHSYLQGTLPKWISDHGPFVLIGVEFPRKHLYADEMLSPNSSILSNLKASPYTMSRGFSSICLICSSSSGPNTIPLNQQRVTAPFVNSMARISRSMSVRPKHDRSRWSRVVLRLRRAQYGGSPFSLLCIHKKYTFTTTLISQFKHCVLIIRAISIPSHSKRVPLFEYALKLLL
jgi:hypothetical protein